MQFENDTEDLLYLLLHEHPSTGPFCTLNGYFTHCDSMKLKVIQSCLTLFKPMDYTIHGILQARILEWVAFR